MADRKIAAAVVMTAAAVSAAGLGTDTPPWNGALTVPGTAVNTDPAGANPYGCRSPVTVRLRLSSFVPMGVASHGISRSRWSAGGVFGLAPSSLTELVLRPAGSR